MEMSTQSFSKVVNLFHQISGIRLVDSKRQLVMGRLQKLAAEHGISDLNQYVDHLATRAEPSELTRVVDRLTTNETYFFREPDHFQFMADLLVKRKGIQPYRVWSAASSSGEEAYSIAMLLADHLGERGNWSILGTDLSTAMVASAQRALYPVERGAHIPQDYLRRYCMKGTGEYDGTFMVNRELRRKVTFEAANLTLPLPNVGMFDIIFLRNVLIYFEPPAKINIVRRVSAQLKPGGYLFTGHSESLSQYDTGLHSLRPAIYVGT